MHAPLIANRRVTTRPVKIGGRKIAAGERVTLMWASANSGIHVCPGAQLARLELRVVMEELLGADPQYSIGAGHAANDRHLSGKRVFQSAHAHQVVCLSPSPCSWVFDIERSGYFTFERDSIPSASFRFEKASPGSAKDILSVCMASDFRAPDADGDLHVVVPSLHPRNRLNMTADVLGDDHRLLLAHIAQQDSKLSPTKATNRVAGAHKETLTELRNCCPAKLQEFVGK